MAKVMVSRGWEVVGVDLAPCGFQHERFTFIQADLNHLHFDKVFELIACVSALEHFGVPGRYGVETLDEEADIIAMATMHSMLAPGGKLILTVPVGLGGIMAPFHRVYDQCRVQDLMDGWIRLEKRYWCKRDGDDSTWVVTGWQQAFTTQAALEPAHYYAIGGFLLTR
jgi:SAM-dependent methyltransferase